MDQEVSGSDALPPRICSSTTVVRVHDNALAERCALTSTTSVTKLSVVRRLSHLDRLKNAILPNLTLKHTPLVWKQNVKLLNLAELLHPIN